MTQSPMTNRNESRNAPNVVVNSPHAVPRWTAILVVCLATYQLMSAFTVPFTNQVWVGELPILAVIQLPKSFLKSVVHSALLTAMHGLGFTYGSASPDNAAIHPWAMGIMVSMPALMLIAMLFSLPRTPHRLRLIVAVVICTTLDAVVTLWFDGVSNFKMYNASYF